MCDCGQYTIVVGGNLRSGGTKSCGCWGRLELLGQKFGRLTVIGENGRSKSRSILWECKCICGKIVSVRADSLRNGATKSCGCLQRQQNPFISITHGRYKSRIYKAWTAMKQRCNNPKSTNYPNYGGRGIKICEQWSKFENFLADMGERPEGMSIERIDNSLGYFPENCCWATRKEQNRNSRHNHLVTYQGETKCLVEWAEDLEIKYDVLRYRLAKYPPEIAFNM